MMEIPDSIALEDFFAKSDFLDSVTEATKARALVWQLMQQAVQENTSPAMTLADLSATVIRSAARTLSMDEDDLVQLLRDHRPH